MGQDGDSGKIVELQGDNQCLPQAQLGESDPDVVIRILSSGLRQMFSVLSPDSAIC